MLLHLALFAGEGNISKHERGRFNEIVKKGGGGGGGGGGWGGRQIVGICGLGTEDIYFKQLRCKLANILKDSTHPLYSEFDSRQIVRSGRLRTPMVSCSL